jgi:hypothetical protein
MVVGVITQQTAEVDVIEWAEGNRARTVLAPCIAARIGAPLAPPGRTLRQEISA